MLLAGAFRHQLCRPSKGRRLQRHPTFGPWRLSIQSCARPRKRRALEGEPRVLGLESGMKAVERAAGRLDGPRTRNLCTRAGQTKLRPCSIATSRTSTSSECIVLQHALDSFGQRTPKCGRSHTSLVRSHSTNLSITSRTTAVAFEYINRG